MKLSTLLIATLVSLTISNSYGQWAYEKVKNDFDSPYKIAYTSINNGAYLKLELLESPCDVMFYISGGYYCDDELWINISFLINGEYEKHLISGIKSGDSKTVFFGNLNAIDVVDENTLKQTPTDFTQLFKSATRVKLRINESHCDDEYYEFSMSGSTAAYNFMTSECPEYMAKIALEKDEREKQDSIARMQKLRMDSSTNAQARMLDSLVTSNNIIDSVEIKGKYPTLAAGFNEPIFNKPQPFANRIQIGKTISDSLYEWDVLKDAYQPGAPATVYVVSYYDWIDPGHNKRFVEIVSADFKVKGWIDSSILKSPSALNKYIDDGKIENKNPSIQKLQPRK